MESVSSCTYGSLNHKHARPSARGTLLYPGQQTKQQSAPTSPFEPVPLGGFCTPAGVAVSPSAPRIIDPGMPPIPRQNWTSPPTSQVVHVSCVRPQKLIHTFVKKMSSSGDGVQHSHPWYAPREVSGHSSVPFSPSVSCVSQSAGALYRNGSDDGDSTASGIGCSSSRLVMRDLSPEFAAEAAHKKRAERVAEELNNMQAELSEARSQFVFAERAAELAKSQCQAQATAAEMDQHTLRTELIEALAKHEDRWESHLKAAGKIAGELAEARAEFVGAQCQAQAIAEISQNAADRNARQLAEAMAEVAVERGRAEECLDIRQKVAECIAELAESRAELTEGRRQAQAMMEFHHTAVENNAKKIAQLQTELAASHRQSLPCAEDADQNAAVSAKMGAACEVACDQAHTRAVFHEKAAECVSVEPTSAFGGLTAESCQDASLISHRAVVERPSFRIQLPNKIKRILRGLFQLHVQSELDSMVSKALLLRLLGVLSLAGAFWIRFTRAAIKGRL
eukprot:TRINITY_DN147_c0_g2_i1.p1 TRINITY_DN147_c0_g2~~TRINITY_DN147_c0_g2_i1.p1  ORF type:complete len:509 (+),score=81.22 TRINITY_DN147_c0_g2_i1:235-1761(+)